MIKSKKLAAYFSASGTTARVAKDLAQAAGAELYEIRPAQPYTSDDLNWMNKKSRSSVEAWNSEGWTFDVLEAHYKTLVRYLDLKDQGMVLGRGCGTTSMTKHSGYPEKAYELGRDL